MRIDDLERLIEAHNKLLSSIVPFTSNGGQNISYEVSNTKQAVQDIAKRISDEANRS